MADLDEVYRQYAQTVYRFLLAKTGSAELAEENVLLNHRRKQKQMSFCPI